VATRVPEGTSPSEVWRMRGSGPVRSPRRAASGARQLPWSQVVFRGLRGGADRCRRRDPREFLRATRMKPCRPRCAARLALCCCPPRPSAVTSPGPSRTSPGARFRVASHPSSALQIFHLLRSVRTLAGPLAVGPEPKLRPRSGPILSWGS